MFIQLLFIILLIIYTVPVPSCTHTVPSCTYTVPSYTLEGSRIVSLSLLGDFISTLTKHAVECKSPLNFLGDSQRYGLASTLVSQCPKCKKNF